MIVMASNIDRVLGQLRKIPEAVRAGQQVALDVGHWKSRAVEVAEITLQAVAHPSDQAFIPQFLRHIAITPMQSGFALRLAPEFDPKAEAARLDVRGVGGLPLFVSAFARSMQEAWDIIRDWVEFAKEIDERDEMPDGTVDYDRVTARIHRILFRPTSEEMLTARERLLQTGDRGKGRGLYLLDFAAGMYAAGAYGLGTATAGAWLKAVAAAWSAMIRTELPSVMVAHINSALRGIRT